MLVVGRFDAPFELGLIAVLAVILHNYGICPAAQVAKVKVNLPDKRRR